MSNNGSLTPTEAPSEPRYVRGASSSTSRPRTADAAGSGSFGVTVGAHTGTVFGEGPASCSGL